MKSFRRSVIRLFLVTFFLLFVAWVGLKAMQYRGDYGRMLRDAQRYLRDNSVVNFFRDRVIPFIQTRVIPFIEGAINSVKRFFG